MTDRTHAASSKNLVWSIAINSVIVVFEMLFGILSGSFALIADALHNATDVGSMGLSLWGVKLADRPQTSRKTYGYKRAEIIIAFVNASVLLAIVGYILIEGVTRLFRPEPIPSLTVMGVAAVALLGNGIATYLLQKNAKNNLNLKSAWLHAMQDAFFSLGVLVSAGIIYFTHWYWLDPLISIIISLYLLKEIYEILAETVHILLDSVPVDLDLTTVRARMLSVAGVVSINDLHIWQAGSASRFLSAHVQIDDRDVAARMEVLAKLQSLLKNESRITHTTLQMVSAKEAALLVEACEHCN